MTNIKEHCCGADRLFDTRTAQKQYKKYLKNGPSSVTRTLIAQLENHATTGTLLDIGGGIGAIQWWFLGQGGQTTIGVDASSGYSQLAQRHAIDHGLDGKTIHHVGDFVTYAHELPAVDHVTLDKVICCYPDYTAILKQACSRSRQTVSLSFPMDGLIANLFRGVMVMGMKLSQNPFKPYIHRVADVRALLTTLGFERLEAGLSFPWYVETYSRKTSN